MREICHLSEGWRFYDGPQDIPTPRHKAVLYTGAKTESRLYGFASMNYVDDPNRCPDRWDVVRVPHDAAVARQPEPARGGTHGFSDYHEIWYRRTLTLPEEDRGRRLLLAFEGVATECEVFFNGTLVARHHSAYTPFEADVSDLARPGERNLIAVRVLPTVYHEGWWYTGSGIVRDVWLIKTDPTAVAMRGVWVRPVEDADGWRCEIEATVFRGGAAEEIAVRQRIVGEGIDAADTVSLSLPAYGTAAARQTLRCGTPRRWDIDDPYQYTCVTELLRGGEVIDAVSTRFGFRTVRFTETACLLNGRPVEIHGFCNHDDYSLTGRAVPPSITRHKLRLQREAGANAYRCSHYMQSEAVMDALDAQGFLVLAETRHFGSADEDLADLETLVRRDRNHPGVFLWSLGNEEDTFRGETGARIARRMIAVLRRLDPDRAVTAAVDKGPATAPIMGEVDVLGINYNSRFLDALHENFPGKPVLYTECAACGTTRGWYGDSDPALGFVSSYDRQLYPWNDSICATWANVAARPFLIGGFQWTGVEYRGESEWPRLCSQSGVIDFFLNRKDTFYLMQALWRDEPVVHVLPHWNWHGREGEVIPVHVFTNCAAVELSLNGRALGRVPCSPTEPARFAVPYEPGVLSAVGYDAAGRPAARDTVETTGAAVGLRLIVENAGDLAPGEVAHVTALVVDADGREVPDAEAEVTFSLTGTAPLGYPETRTIRRAEILGTGSSIADPVPPAVRTRRLRAGRAACAVRLGDGAETILAVRAPGLAAASVRLSD